MAFRGARVDGLKGARGEGNSVREKTRKPIPYIFAKKDRVGFEPFFNEKRRKPNSLYVLQKRAK